MKFGDLNSDKRNLEILNQYLKENFGITVSTNTTVAQVNTWMNAVGREPDMRKRVYLKEALKIVLKEIAPKRKRKRTNESTLMEQALPALIDPGTGSITTQSGQGGRINFTTRSGNVIDITNALKNNPRVAQQFAGQLNARTIGLLSPDDLQRLKDLKPANNNNYRNIVGNQADEALKRTGWLARNASKLRWLGRASGVLAVLDGVFAPSELADGTLPLEYQLASELALRGDHQSAEELFPMADSGMQTWEEIANSDAAKDFQSEIRKGTTTGDGPEQVDPNDEAEDIANVKRLQALQALADIEAAAGQQHRDELEQKRQDAEDASIDTAGLPQPKIEPAPEQPAEPEGEPAPEPPANDPGPDPRGPNVVPLPTPRPDIEPFKPDTTPPADPGKPANDPEPPAQPETPAEPEKKPTTPAPITKPEIPDAPKKPNAPEPEGEPDIETEPPAQPKEPGPEVEPDAPKQPKTPDPIKKPETPSPETKPETPTSPAPFTPGAPDSLPNIDPDAPAKPDVEPVAPEQPQPDAQPDTAPEIAPDTAPEPAPQPEPMPQPEPETQPDPNQEPAQQPEPAPDTAPEVMPDAPTQPQPNPGPAPGTVTQPQPNIQTSPQVITQPAPLAAPQLSTQPRLNPNPAQQTKPGSGSTPVRPRPFIGGLGGKSGNLDKDTYQNWQWSRVPDEYEYDVGGLGPTGLGKTQRPGGQLESKETTTMKQKYMEGFSKLMEQDLDSAELLLAAKDMVDRLQKMAEDVASMQVEDLMSLVDAMRDQFGVDKAEAFNASVESALQSALDTIKNTHSGVDNAIAVLSGDAQAQTDMGAIPGGDMEAPAEPTDDMDVGMDGAEAGAGPEEEPAGREAKDESFESVQQSLFSAINEGKLGKGLLRSVAKKLK